jgi:hypothetical protein
MSKQTAVEWLEETLTMLWGHDFYRFEFEQAKQMEKEQIQKAYDDSVWQFDDDISAEQYYHETYGGDHD